MNNKRATENIGSHEIKHQKVFFEMYCRVFPQKQIANTTHEQLTNDQLMSLYFSHRTYSIGSWVFHTLWQYMELR